MKTYLEHLFFQFAPYFGETFISGYGDIRFAIKIKYTRKHMRCWGNYDGIKFEIKISPILKEYPNALEGVLLHEMVHAFLHAKYFEKNEPSGHTPEFEEIQNHINIQHFGRPDAHRLHFQKMLKERSRNI